MSTQSLPDAFTRYLKGMADLYEVSGVSEADRLAFYNVTRSTLSGSGAIGTGRSVRQTLSRSPAVLRRSDIDGLNMMVNNAAVVGDCDGRSIRAEPGALQFRDMGRPASSRLDSVDLTTVLVPRHLVPPALLRPEIHGLTLSPSVPGVRLVVAQMSILADLADGLPEGQLEAGIEALLLVAASVAGRASPVGAPEMAPLHGAVRRVAAEYVEKRVGALDLPLDIDAVASAGGVSRATLYRAFDGEGGVNRYIQLRRLHHARSALCRRRGAGPSIAEISHRYGFASPNHFSRLFRIRYGYSPSEVEMTGAPPDVSMTTGPIRHDILANWIETLGRGVFSTKPSRPVRST